MHVKIVKAKNLFKPEDELVVIKMGELTILKKHKSLSGILHETSKKFKDISEEEKEKISIEAKKWVRRKLR